MILELRPIHFSFAVCGFYQYNVCREREDFERDSQPRVQVPKADPPPSAKDDNKKATTKGNSKKATIKRRDTA
jgi:hypothetical protein